MRKKFTLFSLIFLGLLLTSINANQIDRTLSDVVPDSNSIDASDTCWVMVSSCLVMLMTPALGFFYGGFLDSKTFTLVVAQCLAIFCVTTVIWNLVGFSLSFGDSQSNFIGGFKYAALQNIDFKPFEYSPKIPALLFVFFQNKFAAITPALIIGSTAGRLSLFSIIIFSTVWSLIGYCPIAYWNWNNDGYLKKLGVIDFAGGNVVHISSGFSGLAAALVCDKIEKHLKIEKTEKNQPSLMIIILGTTLLWFGWFGFNGGSSLGANAQGVLALINTNLAACTALITYALIGYIVNKRPSVNDMCIGSVCGLVGITPGAGYVPIYASGIIGVVTAAICYLACFIKEKYKLFDDRLDAFGCHGVGGFIGALLTGLFAVERYGGVNGAFYGSGIQFAYQLAGASVCALWSFIITAVFLIIMFYCKLLTFDSNFSEYAIGAQFGVISSTDIEEKKKIVTFEELEIPKIVIKENNEEIVKITKREDEINLNDPSRRQETIGISERK